MRETSYVRNSKRATKKQFDKFYERQKKYRDKVDNKLALQRAENKSDNSDECIGVPKINKVSKDIKRSYQDLLAWKANADTKIMRQRETKENEEIATLRSFRSSFTGMFLIVYNCIGSQLKRSCSQNVISSKSKHPKTPPKTAIWPLRFEKPGSATSNSQMSMIYHSKDLSQNTIDNQDISFF